MRLFYHVRGMYDRMSYCFDYTADDCEFVDAHDDFGTELLLENINWLYVHASKCVPHEIAHKLSWYYSSFIDTDRTTQNDECGPQ